MTGEEMERAIQFLTEHQARVSVDLARVSNDIDKLKDAQERTTANIDKLTEEMREGFNNLIISNEVTRDFASDVARLAVQTSKRVTALEDRSN
jgi:hypothetical protein